MDSGHLIGPLYPRYREVNLVFFHWHYILASMETGGIVALKLESLRACFLLQCLFQTQLLLLPHFFIVLERIARLHLYFRRIRTCYLLSSTVPAASVVSHVSYLFIG